MLRKILNQYRRRHLAAWRKDDDHPAFDYVVAGYRKRGVQIGKMVRLLGVVDGVNPHLVSIGDYSIFGLHSALLAHCPIRGALPCRIGSFVYIGYGAIILPGVTVGDNCLTGAGTRDQGRTVRQYSCRQSGEGCLPIDT